MNIKESNIAIIHDWFLRNSIAGSEKVTFMMHDFFEKQYSSPKIFSITSNLNKANTKFLRNSEIKTSFIQFLPFGKNNVQNFLPLLPYAIEQLDLSKYELIISSSHAFSKGVLTSPDQLHISYVHTPMRYAWDQMNTYLQQSKLSRLGFEIPIRYVLYKLREWDYTSSQRIDYLIANSNFTAKRIKKYWGLNSEVIHPPVDLSRFNCNKNRGDFYLSVNRLVPNKRIDILVNTFNKLKLPLVIIGDGPERKKLEKIAKSNIKFLRKISDINVAKYMSECRAFVYAGIEDFGIAPVEAMASGSPVIAYAKGGVLDTVNCLTKYNKDQIPNGILFKKQSSEELFDTINWFEETKSWKNFDPKLLNNFAQNFNYKNFYDKFDSFINKAWDEFQMKNRS